MSAAAVETLDTNQALNPNALLDHLIKTFGWKNDAGLSRALNVAPPVISKIRHDRLPVGATLLISMHEETGYSIGELRGLMGDRRVKFRESKNSSAKAA